MTTAAITKLANAASTENAIVTPSMAKVTLI
jgi:hypothetical protein